MINKNITLWMGILFCSILLFLTVFGPSLPFVTMEIAEPYIIHDDGTIETPPYAPSDKYLLGTDVDGRELVSLVIVGARETLLLVVIITFVRYVLAIPLAIVASKQEGIIYWLLNGWNQIFSGLPTLFAAILFLHLPFIEISDHRTVWVIILIALLEVGRVGYIFQQQAYDLSKSVFVEAGVMIGNGKLGIYKRYYLPYLLPQMIVNFVLDLGRVMLILGQLAFFNIFVSQEWVRIELSEWMIVNTYNDWLSMLAGSRRYIRTETWIPLVPVVAIAFSILTFNFLGEGLRRYFEDRSKSNYNPKLEQEEEKKLKAARGGRYHEKKHTYMV